jgi:16S rRNA U516 pseudouridylate synthase RsuA-like enzyme
MTRINKFVAAATGMSRRAADTIIAENRVHINGAPATSGYDVQTTDTVTLDGTPLAAATTMQTIMLNKPVSYVVSRDGQGSRTVYDLLPPELHNLKPIGRLDKESSGLLLLTTDGNLAQTLTHPSHQKVKQYEITVSSWPTAPASFNSAAAHQATIPIGLSPCTKGATVKSAARSRRLAIPLPHSTASNSDHTN